MNPSKGHKMLFLLRTANFFIQGIFYLEIWSGKIIFWQPALTPYMTIMNRTKKTALDGNVDYVMMMMVSWDIPIWWLWRFDEEKLPGCERGWSRAGYHYHDYDYDDYYDYDYDDHHKDLKEKTLRLWAWLVERPATRGATMGRSTTPR